MRRIVAARHHVDARAARGEERGTPLPVARMRRHDDHAAARITGGLVMMLPAYHDRPLERFAAHAPEREKVGEREREVLEGVTRTVLQGRTRPTIVRGRSGRPVAFDMTDVTSTHVSLRKSIAKGAG